jgi:hypothetical protein
VFWSGSAMYSLVLAPQAPNQKPPHQTHLIGQPCLSTTAPNSNNSYSSTAPIVGPVSISNPSLYGSIRRDTQYTWGSLPITGQPPVPSSPCAAAASFRSHRCSSWHHPTIPTIPTLVRIRPGPTVGLGCIYQLREMDPAAINIPPPFWSFR